MGYFHNNTADNNAFLCKNPIYLKKNDDLATFGATLDLYTHTHTNTHNAYMLYTYTLYTVLI